MELSDNGPANGAREIASRLQRAGYIAYWAGGCVRDALLGRTPADYDIATNALPDTVIALFPEALTVGKAFGVVTVPLGDTHYEVATFRHDEGYTDGRRPDRVTFTTPEDDAARRDFTVNALFYDPATDRIHDFVGGRHDLAARCIRCVGDPDRRFDEDHLRLLRAVRFAATLDFTLHPATAEAIARHAASLARISVERVQVELTRILLEPRRPGDAIEQLHALGLLNVILPEAGAMRGQAQPPEFHPEGDVLTHTCLMLNLMVDRSAELAYAVLLHDVGKPRTATLDGERLRFNNHASVGAAMADTILLRLKLPRRLIDAVVPCVANHMRFTDVRRMRRSTLRRMIGAATFPIELELHRLDCLASHGILDHYEFLRQSHAEMVEEPVLPPAWITGRDLLALGVPSGPAIGAWLREAYDRQLDGADADRETQLNWLRDAVNAASG